MWWWRKTFLAAGCALALGLSACGFHPMYGDAANDASASTALQGNVQIAPVGGGGRFAQVLKNALEDKFNPQSSPSANPHYTLSVNFKRSLTPSVVRSDGTILRYEVKFETSYTLTDNTKKTLPYNGTVRRISSYNVVPNANFATYEAEENLNERMLREIAEDYVLRISGHLAGKS